MSRWDQLKEKLHNYHQDQVEKEEKKKDSINKVSLFTKQSEALNSRNLSPTKIDNKIVGGTITSSLTQSSKDEDIDDIDITDDLFKKTFSVETNKNGSREFIVTSYKGFWRMYSLLEPDQRHHYEVIGENDPCRLYLDVEYERGCNPHLDGLGDNVIIDILIKQLIKEIKLVFNIDTDATHVIDLDSSTPIKFSRHLIWHIPNSYFKNNLIIGLFINNFIKKMELERDKIKKQKEEKEKEEELDSKKRKFDEFDLDDMIFDQDDDDILYLFVQNDKSKIVSIIDPSVYSRNRNFRLYLSSKFGKTKQLELYKNCLFKFNNNQNNNQEEEIFLNSLCCNLNDLIFSGKDIKVLEFNDDQSISNRKSSMSSSSEQPKILSKSKYKLLDAYIIGLVRPNGYIRSIRYMEQSQLLIFNIQGNRYCANINREHKSNNIYYEVSLRNNTLCQKCMDSDCKGFRSPSVVINDYLKEE